MAKDDRKRLLMLGASGRLGRLLHAAWSDPAVALNCQTRHEATRPGWQVFDPLRDNDLLVAALAGADAVINLAGPVPRGSTVDLTLHSRLALATLRAARAARVRQVFVVSSAAVYGRATGPSAESDPRTPISAYGRAKAEMERAVAAHIATTPDAPATTILRIGNVVGADQLLGQVANRAPYLDRFPNGRGPQRSYIGPATLARVVARLVSISAAIHLPPVLNIATPAPVAMADLLHAAGSAWQDRAAPKGAIPAVHLDTRLLERLVPFPAASQTAAGMVEEWRAVAPQPC